MEDWRWMSASELGRGIRSRRIDPVDLTEVFLAASERHEHRDRIWARLTPDRARAEARSAGARAKAGQPLSPLDGVPISWKDLYDTAGVATEAGTRLLKGRTPDRDAEVLKNAGRAGLVCLGKTHMTELAFSGLGLNPMTASPPNSVIDGAVSGGSSSGAAASVAFGLAAAAIGSDTGGSVRVPAAWNDLVGLKTVHGRLSLAGVVPLCARFDTVGPLCRSVEDAGLLLSALEGRSQPQHQKFALSEARLAILRTSAFDHLEEPVGAAFETAMTRLGEAGAKIEDFDAPEVAEAMTLAPHLYAPEAYATWGERIEADPDAMYPPVRERFRSGRAVSEAEWSAAWSKLTELRQIHARRSGQFDAVILPTVPILPPQIAAVEADSAHFTERNLKALHNTRIGNLLGLGGVTMPTGTHAAGLLLQGPSEERLLTVAQAVEKALA